MMRALCSAFHPYLSLTLPSSLLASLHVIVASIPDRSQLSFRRLVNMGAIYWVRQIHTPSHDDYYTHFVRLGPSKGRIFFDLPHNVHLELSRFRSYKVPRALALQGLLSFPLIFMMSINHRRVYLGSYSFFLHILIVKSNFCLPNFPFLSCPHPSKICASRGGLYFKSSTRSTKNGPLRSGTTARLNRHLHPYMFSHLQRARRLVGHPTRVPRTVPAVHLFGY